MNPDPNSCCDHHESGSGHNHKHHQDQEAKPSKKPAAYYCPMCPGVESDVPGDCPQCGMPLERNPGYRTTQVKLWTCPMHPEVQQDHPGPCPKCGMDLEPLPMADDDHGDDEILRLKVLGLRDL